MLALSLAATLVHADDYLSPTNERVRLSLGFMHLSSTTDLRLDSGQGLPGTSINAEDVFGLDSSDFEPKFQAMVRVGERHRLRFDILLWIGPADHAHRPGRVPECGVADRRSGEFQLEHAHARHHLRILVSPSREIRTGRNHRRHDTDISARARVATQTRHVDPARRPGRPIPDARPGFDLRVEQTFLFRCGARNT